MFAKKNGGHNVTQGWDFYLNHYRRLDSGTCTQKFMYKILVPQG